MPNFIRIKLVFHGHADPQNTSVNYAQKRKNLERIDAVQDGTVELGNAPIYTDAMRMAQAFQIISYSENFNVHDGTARWSSSEEGGQLLNSVNVDVAYPNAPSSSAAYEEVRQAVHDFERRCGALPKTEIFLDDFVLDSM